MQTKYNQILQLVTFSATLVVHATTSAQHVDVLVWDQDGTVGVGQYDYDNAVASEQRVHIARLDSFYSVNNPGFTSFSGPEALPGNADLKWDFLPMTVDSGTHSGYQSNLLYWDGVGSEPNFGPTSTEDYELTLYGKNAPATADGTSEVITGDVIDRTPPNGAIHEHLYFFLDDNGDGLNTTLPDAGVYVLSMRLSIDGLEQSEPFFYVWATPELEVLPAILPSAIWVNERLDTLVIEPLAGDYNADGTVDAADYTVWRDTFGQANGVLSADGNQDGVVDDMDYIVWQNNYGLSSAALASANSTAVPEPNTFLLVLTILICFVGMPRSPVFLGA